MTIPGKKISQFPDGGAVQDKDQFAIARAGQNFFINGSEVCGVGQKRLSLESSVLVPTTDQTAKTIVYWTDGTTNLSVSVPATTNMPFDVFYDLSDETLSTTDWANDTIRATFLVYDKGRLVKLGDTDKIYLGTGRTTAVSGRCEDSTTKRFIWNYYNRVSRSLQVTGAATHTNTDTAIANWNGDATLRVEWVNGRIVGDYLVSILTDMTCAATSSTTQGCVGLGINTTAALSGVIYWQSAFRGRSTGMATAQPLSGHNYIQLMERGLTGVTFYVAQINMTVMV